MLLQNLDCWISFYFQHGRFPASQNLISIPKVSSPYFLKTDMPIPPVDLYKKYAATDAKALVSFHALAVLNIHLGEIHTYLKQHLANT